MYSVDTFIQDRLYSRHCARPCYLYMNGEDMVCLHNAERGDEMSDAIRPPVIGTSRGVWVICSGGSKEGAIISAWKGFMQERHLAWP